MEPVIPLLVLGVRYRIRLKTKMKKISEAHKPTEIFFAISPGKYGMS